MSLNRTFPSAIELSFWGGLAFVDVSCFIIATLAFRRHRRILGNFPFNFFFAQTITALIASTFFLTFLFTRSLCLLYSCPKYAEAALFGPYLYFLTCCYILSIFLSIGLVLFIHRPFDGGYEISKSIFWIFVVSFFLTLATVALHYMYSSDPTWKIDGLANFTDYFLLAAFVISLFSVVYMIYKLRGLQDSKELMKIKKTIIMQYFVICGSYLVSWLISAISLYFELYVDHTYYATWEQLLLFYGTNFDDIGFGFISFCFWFFISTLRTPLAETVLAAITCNMKKLTQDDYHLDSPLVEKYFDISDLNIIFQRNLLACSVFGISKSIEDIDIWSHVTVDHALLESRSFLNQDMKINERRKTHSSLSFRTTGDSSDEVEYLCPTNTDEEFNNDMEKSDLERSGKFASEVRDLKSSFRPFGNIKRAYDFSSIYDQVQSLDRDIFYLSDFEMEIISPEVFYHIRLMRGVNHELYLKDLEPNSFMKSVISSSSGKKFYAYSRKRYLIIQTISDQEFLFFQSILSRYHSYITSNPNTLVVYIFGLYRMKVHGVSVNVIVMENLFHGFDENDALISYDLSGRRESMKEKQNAMLSQSLYFTDEDIREPIHFPLSVQQRQSIAQQIHRDTTFLASLNIVNYRLFCAYTKQDDFGPMEKRFYLRDRITKRPNLFFHKERIYILGMFNLFHEYNYSRKLRNFLQRFNCLGQVTVLDPKSYQLRFEIAMDKYFRLRFDKEIAYRESLDLREFI